MQVLPFRVAPVPFVARLASFGDRPALVGGGGSVTYADLAARVDAFATRLGDGRRLVLVAGANTVESVVAYLAALSAGHPVILVAGEGPANLESISAAYDPDVVVHGDTVEHRRDGSAHDLHPDLALLLSTSGSTGSPKLVRLSGASLQANAESIASYLSIRKTDVAATTLPLHYCYGLSVLNSHLARGAALLLTDLSVVDRCFWELFRRHGATSFAGVPYTFDLLDRVGFDALELPSLRYVTQAGGRLAPAQVQRYAALGQRRGFDLFVMYGQTEATARMAYLPPDLALAHPGAIGVPVPGGTLTLEPLPGEPDLGELVYSGPNVMLGYAERPSDLAAGRVVSVLRTGDLARRNDAGLLEIVGRRDRFTKIFGLRIDLDRAERVLAEAGLPVHCAATDDVLVIGVERPHARDAARVADLARGQFGLPAGAVRVCELDELPRLPSGKVDHRTLAGLGTGPAAPPDADRPADQPTDLRAVYALVLGRHDVSEHDSFVSLGGDSLSYVEMSIRLEDALGHLPLDWHVTPIRDLTTEVAAPGRLRTVETNVLLRAAAILAIVATHANLLTLTGGAHLLLGLAGFNFARFQLGSASRAERAGSLATSITRVVVPSVLWLGAVNAVTGDYSWQTVTLLNGALGPQAWSEPGWHYWFVEAVVYTLLGVLALMAVPWVHRVERRWPFWFPVTLAVLGLLTRYEVVLLRGGDVVHRAHVVFWLFALGWAASRATTVRHRLVVSALLVATVPGFFDDIAREAVVVAGMLLLVWRPHVRVPAVVARAAGVLASASLYVYLSHWQVYPHLEDSYPLLAVVLSLAVGIGFWQVVSRVTARLPRRTPAARHGRPQPAAR